MRELKSGIEDDILPITAAKDIGVDARHAREEIIAQPAIERVGVEDAVNRIVAIGFGIGDHLLDNVGVFERRALIEDDLLDQIGCDIIEPHITADGSRQTGRRQG